MGVSLVDPWFGKVLVSEGHPWIGERVRGISERSLQVFDRSGKVLDILEDGQVEWLPEGLFIPWRSWENDLEFLPALLPRGKGKTGRCSQAELKELRLRIPGLDQQLQPGESLTSDHLALGDWQIWRDTQRDVKESPVRSPVLLNPEVVVGLTGESADIRTKCGQILVGHWKKYGLLGVPIGAGGHWTLLTFRRSGGAEFVVHEGEEFLNIKYYDSLEGMSKSCWEVAEKVLWFVAPGLDTQVVKLNSCRTFQTDASSCGLFVLHYWEGEVRQFLGQGWSVGRPFMKVVGARRARLIHTSKEIENFVKAEKEKLEKAEKEGKAKKVESIKETPTDGPIVPKAEKFMAFLASEAARSLEVALVPFYGCPRCRHSRGGCIDWKCNPLKFMAHMEKFPEKYENKKIKPLAWKTISLGEVRGEL